MAFIGPGLYHMATAFVVGTFVVLSSWCQSLPKHFPSGPGAQLPAVGHVYLNPKYLSFRVSFIIGPF